MSFRNLSSIVAISCLAALSGCAQLGLHPSSGPSASKATQTLDDPAYRAKAISEQADDIRRAANDGVIRRIRAAGAEKCLTETETELMVADFSASLDAELESVRKSSLDCCRPGAREDATSLSRRMKDLNGHIVDYKGAASDDKILRLINSYGPQASANRQSDTCQTRMKKIEDYLQKEGGKPTTAAAIAGVKPGKSDPAGIEVLMPEFEKKIKALELYRNLIGPVSP